MHTVFISYAEADGAIARTLAEALEELRMPCWYYQRDFQVGQTHLRASERAIDKALVFVIIVSKDSLSSDFVFPEILHGVAQEKSFIPILVGMTHRQLEEMKPRWIAAIGSFPSMEWDVTRVREITARVAAAVGVTKTGGIETWIEAVIRNDLTEGGAYIGSVEDEVCRKARDQCRDVRSKVRAALVGVFRPEEFRSEDEVLHFGSSWVSATAARVRGNSFEVTYRVTTTIHLKSSSTRLLARLASKIGRYSELRFQMLERCQPTSIAEINTALHDFLVVLDDERVKYVVGNLEFGLVSNLEGTLITIGHRSKTFDASIHETLDGLSVLSYLRDGKSSNDTLSALLHDHGPSS